MIYRSTLVVGLAFLVAVWSSQAAAASLTGKVVRILDGDTITLLAPGRKQVRIRLAEIDAPEKKQPWGKRAKKALSKIVGKGERVKVEIVDHDRYGRAIGKVYAGNTYVNAEMVRSGNAWVYRKYSDNRRLIELENIARIKKKGLWTLPERDRVPPWEWRHKAR